MVLPTATQLVAVEHEIPDRDVRALAGTGATDHLEPFQARTRCPVGALPAA